MWGRLLRTQGRLQSDISDAHIFDQFSSLTAWETSIQKIYPLLTYVREQIN